MCYRSASGAPWEILKSKTESLQALPCTAQGCISYLEIFTTLFISVKIIYLCKDNFIRCLKEKTDTEINRTDSVSPIVTIIKRPKHHLYRRPNSSWKWLDSLFFPESYFLFPLIIYLLHVLSFIAIVLIGCVCTCQLNRNRNRKL